MIYVHIHYMIQHYIILYYITLNYIALQYITLDYIILHYIALYAIILQYITLYYIILYYIILHYIIILYHIIICYITLHYIKLYYIISYYSILYYIIWYYIFIKLYRIIVLKPQSWLVKRKKHTAPMVQRIPNLKWFPEKRRHQARGRVKWRIYGLCWLAKYTIYDIWYPLVNVYITMERSTIFNGEIHYFYGHFQ